MGFFDLNIPFLETTKSTTSSQNQTLKHNRLKFVIRTMEFGYTGVAYNRTIKGVISDADYCAIPLFTPSSLIKLLPALSASSKFHRDLLGVPSSAPFRQYTRLTVSVDSAAQAMLLNSTNPVLKSYNIVAAKPLNQNAFDQACQFSEVDIISIDFTDKLPFRLKQPIVKAAIKRSVYFEIAYFGLIRDVQTRCQVIANAKMLVDWTSGKNIILTSATSSANELRGPYDIVNLASLLGMSMERAKAAVSKNCRNLISKALRKRQYHNEAIEVVPLTTTEQLKFSDLSSGNWLNWDPISSGQGDLLLDDVEKCLLASSDYSKVKAINFTSIMKDLPSNGLQLKDILSGATQLSESQNLEDEVSDRVTEATSVNLVLSEVADAASVNTPLVESQDQLGELSDRIKNATNVEPVLSKSYHNDVGDNVALNFQLIPHSVLQAKDSCMKDVSYGLEKLVSQQPSETPSQVGMVDDDLPMAEVKDVQMTNSSVVNPDSAHENFEKSTLSQRTGYEVVTNHVPIIKESMNPNVSEAPLLFGDGVQSDWQSQNFNMSCKLDIMQDGEGLDSPKHAEDVMVHDSYREGFSVPSANIEVPENIDAADDMQYRASGGIHKATSPVHNILLGGGQVDSAVNNYVIDGRELVESCTEVENGESLNSDRKQATELIVDDFCREDECKSMDDAVKGKHRESRKSHRAAIFPLKHLLNHTHFKNKKRKVKGKAKKV